MVRYDADTDHQSACNISTNFLLQVGIQKRKIVASELSITDALSRVVSSAGSIVARFKQAIHIDWSSESQIVVATILVILVFGFICIVMVRLESDIGNRQLCTSSRAGTRETTNPSYRMIDGTTNILELAMQPEKEPMLKTKASLRKLRLASISTGVLMVVILIIGHAIKSLSLVGDGIHLIGDTLGYFGLFFATVASQWDSDETFTYGLGRVEYLSALAVIAIQYHEALEISYEAYERFWNPKPLDEHAGMLITCLSFLSLLVNIGLAFMMSSSGSASCGHNHGDAAVGMAFVHLLCDIGQNAIVIIAGAVLWLRPQYYAVDPICVLFFLAMLLLGTLPRVREIVVLFLEASPGNLNCRQLRQDLRNIKGVTHVKDFHAWCITPGKVAITAHIYVQDESMDVLQQAEIIAKHRYGIQYSTFQVSDDELD
jgi:zinc transporter 2